MRFGSCSSSCTSSVFPVIALKGRTSLAALLVVATRWSEKSNSAGNKASPKAAANATMDNFYRFMGSSSQPLLGVINSIMPKPPPSPVRLPQGEELCIC